MVCGGGAVVTAVCGGLVAVGVVCVAAAVVVCVVVAVVSVGAVVVAAGVVVSGGFEVVIGVVVVEVSLLVSALVSVLCCGVSLFEQPQRAISRDRINGVILKFFINFPFN